MAKPAFIIQFPSPASSALMHRALNFIEELHWALEKHSIGRINDIDHYASGCFVLDGVSRRNIGQVSSLIATLLKRHNLEREAVVSRADRAG